MAKEKPVVLITGGGHGIGKVLVREYVNARHRVVLVDINSRCMEKFKDIQDDILFVCMDLSIETEISDLIGLISEKEGRLDAIINNARPRLKKTSELAMLDGWDQGIGVLLKAPALIAEKSLSILKQSANASIINIASTNGYLIAPQPMVYHVAKAAMIHMTRYLAYNLGKLGVRVNGIAPGLVDLYDDNAPLTSRPNHQRVTEVSVPLGRAASAEEIAKLSLFLTSDRSSYLNGQTIILDGGMTLGDQFHVAQTAFAEAHE